jgi:hypothetical protein
MAQLKYYDSISETWKIAVVGAQGPQGVQGIQGIQGATGPDGLPDQEANEGKYLTTDGTAAFWETVDALPEQTGNEGKYLTTDGTDPEWAFLSGGSAATEPPTVGLVDGSIWLDTDGEIQAPNGRLVRWVKTATAGQTIFSGAADGPGSTLNYRPASEQVFLNGIQLVRGSDYTASDGETVVLIEGTSELDILQVVSIPFIVNTSNVITEENFQAKGNILVATDTNSPIAFSVGTNGQILRVNSLTPTSLEWVNPTTYDAPIEENYILNLMGAV